MTTDWILIRRAAAELDRALAGGRVTDLGLLDDGRIALRVGGLRAARKTATLAADPFGTPPLVTLGDEEPAAGIDPGWLRTAAALLRGMRVLEVRARRLDRVLVVRLGTSSRFGVESEARLVLELVPRYGNAVVLRDRTVVAAAKQFSPAENPARAVQVGLPYEPPPLPPPSGARAALPRALAATVTTEAEAAALLARAEAAAADPDAPVLVDRDAGGAPLQAHLVPLPPPPETTRTAEPAILTVFSQARGAGARLRHGDALTRRRAALTQRAVRRIAAIDAEREAVAARLADARGRETLRRAGDALFTHGHEVPAGATSFVPPSDPELTIALDPERDAKQNAREYYGRYRKAADALPHLERRLEALRARRDALDEIAFAALDADAATLAELEAAAGALEGRPPQRARGGAARPRPPLRVELPSGARLYAGRSPRENVEVTFRIARPDDLWFHARGIPGAHVVLQPPAGAAPSDEDLAAAADLAATHSKGRAAGRVEIDYTERKYVRAQRDAPPGLVWYTNARTRVGRPTEGSL